MTVATAVTVMGLGVMGSALARALLTAGHRITVWNRSAGRAIPFSNLGANTAETVSEALLASPVILICVDNYEVSTEMIAEENIGNSLCGKILIQLSTGTPRQVIEFGRRVKAFGCKYIDGAIMCFPENIGLKEAQFLFAGSKGAYDYCEPTLRCLGGDLRYLGSEVTAAAAIDLAFLTQELANCLGAIHGAHICETEKVGIDTFASILPDGHPAKDLLRNIYLNKFDSPNASIAVWNRALNKIQMQAHDAGIDSEIPNLISRLFRRAISAGYTEEGIAALIKILRNDSR